MIDIKTETLYRFRDAVRFLPQRKRSVTAGVEALNRYVREGINGATLEYVLTGKSERSTSAEAIQRFFDSATAADRTTAFVKECPPESLVRRSEQAMKRMQDRMEAAKHRRRSKQTN